MNPPTFHVAHLADLHEDPANARKHPEPNRLVVAGSLKEFGQVQVLVVERGTGRVIGGNCTLGECRALGMEEVQVCEVDAHGVDAARLALILNRSAELATWDDEALKALLAEVDTEGLGWNQEELDALLAAIEPPTAPTIQAVQGTYAILVTCKDELQQRQLLERFTEEELECRAWNL
ncbi:MAG: hypothetical protein WC911_10990 [Thermoleophilia bacterium]